MRTASLDKSSQVSFEHYWKAYRNVSDLIVTYPVRKSVRRMAASHRLLTKRLNQLPLSVRIYLQDQYGKRRPSLCVATSRYVPRLSNTDANPHQLDGE